MLTILHRPARRHHGLGRGPAFPDVALQLIGGAWTVVEGNTEEPDGYFTLSDGALVIDDEASSGLAITLGGPLLVAT